uniref:Uncharacterized protein n=1 Tax=Cucumis melo TaxID=3656 RepID=A0A9I9EHP9_CUCME
MESLTSLLLISLSQVNRDWRCWSKSPSSSFTSTTKDHVEL